MLPPRGGLALLVLLLSACQGGDDPEGEADTDTAGTEDTDTGGGGDTGDTGETGDTAETGTGDSADTQDTVDTGPDPLVYDHELLVEVDDGLGGSVTAAVWNPDGSAFVVGYTSHSAFWQMFDATTNTVLLAEDRSGDCPELTWIPGTDQFAATGTDYGRYDGITGEPLGHLGICTGTPQGIGFDATGTRYATAGTGQSFSEPEMCVGSLPEFAVEEDSSVDLYEGLDAAFSVDGGTLVGLFTTSGTETRLVIWDSALEFIDNAGISGYHDGHSGHLVTSPLLPDYIFFPASDYGDLLALRVSDLQLVYLGISNDPVTAIAFSPDGTLAAIATDDGRVALYNSDLSERLDGWPAGDSVQTLAFSDDGTRLITGGEGPQFSVWSIVAE